MATSRGILKEIYIFWIISLKIFNNGSTSAQKQGTTISLIKKLE